MSPLETAECTALLDALSGISICAALTILKSDGAAGLRLKADGSPVTPADEAAEAVIRAGLERHAPGIRIVSEEQAESRPSAVSDGVFLVDPLDGTRDFIAGRNEYTVNIALLRGGAPVLGVITAPALRLSWRGSVERGAERMGFTLDGKISPPQAIHSRRPVAREISVMVSRSHLDPDTKRYLATLTGAQTIVCGSSLKFCRLAEGSADHYPRLAPTRDWDVAAGHAILGAAGGRIMRPDGGAIIYGTRKRLIPAFVAWGGATEGEPTDGASG